MGVMPAVPERALKGGQPLLSSSGGGGEEKPIRDSQSPKQRLRDGDKNPIRDPQSLKQQLQELGGKKP